MLLSGQGMILYQRGLSRNLRHRNFSTCKHLSPSYFSLNTLPISLLFFKFFVNDMVLRSRFIKEYGKWIGFPPLPTLLNHLRHHSPLLLTATSLIASRHLPHSDNLDTLVTSLFSESRRLLSLALLDVPRNVETLQAILILSVWSPLAKREAPQNRPLAGGRTLDSWLVSGYGVMLGMTVIRFNDLTRRGSGEFKGPRTPVGGTIKENGEGVSQRLRVWNHLCLIHLQYIPQVLLSPVFCLQVLCFRVMLSWSI